MVDDDLKERVGLLEAVKDLEEEVGGEKMEDLEERRIKLLEAIKDLEDEVGGEKMEDLRERVRLLERAKELEA